ncbi:MAG: glycosyltransferase family 4 protein [Gemmataceae bacterium]
MNIAFCYESVLPERGGCETYITDLARRLLSEGHQVHLYASRWDETRMPDGVQYHRIPRVSGPRFLRPWKFAARCEKALASNVHDVSIGFNKTWGQDILYPQGGLHAASFEHNLRKYPQEWMRYLVRVLKGGDLAHRSFTRLEQKQYLACPPTAIVVNSFMVRRHFHEHYGIQPEQLHVIRSAIDPNRFCETDRPRRRLEWRSRWNIPANETVGLFAAMNYRLKGLVPLLHSVATLFNTPEYQPRAREFRLVVAGHPNHRRYLRMAQRLGIADKVTFVGHCGEMREAYFAADFLIHPTFYDPCSLVALEALACALPVVTTRYNGASELLEQGQNGYVVDDPHNHSQLAWSMAQLLDPEHRNRCASAARKTGNSWTFDHHYQQLRQLFEQIAAKKAAA